MDGLDYFRGLVTPAGVQSSSLEDLAFAAAELEWMARARKKQLPPPKQPVPWSIWMTLAGRGFGKTDMGANWCRRKAWTMPGSIGHVFAPTGSDLDGTVFDGPAGLLRMIPDELIEDYNKSSHVLRLKNKSMIRGFSAETPNRIRGPQCHWAWCDEMAAWQYLDDAWSNIIFSTRLPYLGEEIEILITTTPKPLPLIRDLLKRPDVKSVGGSTYENRKNLSKKFFEEIVQYEGTKLGDQEIHGLVLDPEDSGIIKRSWWKLWPANEKLPVFEHVLLSLDTAFTEETFDEKKLEADFSAGSTWGYFTWKKKPGMMLLDCWEERLGFPDLVDRVKEESQKRYGATNQPLIKFAVLGPHPPPKTGGRRIDTILIEDKGSGKSLRQTLARERIITAGFNPGNADKLQRLHAVSHAFKHGYVWAVESQKKTGFPRTWAEPLIGQVCSFYGERTIRHDDLLDTATQAVRYLMMTQGIKVNPRPEDKPDYDEPEPNYSNPYGV